MTKDTISNKTKKGFFWGVGSQLTRQVFSIFTTILLVRLLTPNDLGLMALVLIFTDLANILINMGLNSTIIQDDEIDHQGATSVFWFNTLIGVFLMLVLIVSAPSLARYFETPVLRPLFIGISIVYFLFSLELVPKALLEKKLDYKSIAIAETTSLIFSGVVAILLAYWGYGVWALVWQLLINSFLTVILLWYYANWLPQLSFNGSYIRRTRNLSSSILYSQVLQIITKALSRLLIGKHISKATLGFYDKAESFSSIPRNNASRILLSVGFSAFAKLKNQPSIISKNYLQIMKYIILINYPIMIGIMVATKYIVSVLFGQQWMGMVPFLQIFAVVMLFSSFNSLLGSIFLARGMSKMVIKDTTIREGLLILGIIIGFNWGAIGVAYGIAGAQFFNFVLTLYHAKEVAYVSIKTQLTTIKPFLIASVIMGLILYIFNTETQGQLKNYTALLINMGIGLTTYLTALWLQKDQTVKELLQFLQLSRQQ